MFWFWAFEKEKKKKKTFWVLGTRPFEKATYVPLLYRIRSKRSSEKSFEKWSFEKYFLKWSFFLGDCDQVLEKAAYIPLS